MIVYECTCIIYFDHFQSGNYVLVDVNKIMRFKTPNFIKKENIEFVVAECLEEFYGICGFNKNNFDMISVKIKKGGAKWEILYPQSNLLDSDDEAIVIDEIPDDIIKNALKQIKNE